VFAIILVVLAGALSVLAWHLVKSAPRVLSLVLPAGITFVIGLALFVTAVFAAFFAVYEQRNAEGMLLCFVQGYVGLWFMLSPSAAARGSEQDEQLLRRLFVMMGLMMAAIIGGLYATDGRSLAVVHLALVTAGFWVTTNYLRFLDGGR
jgi:hypothetical protein